MERQIGAPGDVTQIDLPRGKKSGLVEVRGVLKGVRGIAFQDFLAEDVVRLRWCRRSLRLMSSTRRVAVKISRDKG